MLSAHELEDAVNRFIDPLQRPLGYWLKQTDALITAGIERLLEDRGLRRVHWQSLNALAAADRTSRADLGEVMSAFLDSAAVDAVLADFDRNGWIMRTGDPGAGELVGLTDAGLATRAELDVEIAAFRTRVQEGISDSDYETTVRTLHRMVENLSAAAG